MSILLSPLSKVKVTPYSTTITTETIAPMSPLWSPTVIVPKSISTIVPLYQLEVDTGLNENPFAQQQMLDYIMAKVYNKWIYSKDMCYLLKYLKIVNGKVTYLSSPDEFKNNKICDDTEENVELKIDFIQENILTKADLKKLLKRLIDELGYKWYEFPQKEETIAESVEKYIKGKLKENIGSIAK